MFNCTTEEFPWDDLRKFLPGCQQMASVPNGVGTLPKISIAWVGCTNVTDRRQTDDRRQFTLYTSITQTYRHELTAARTSSLTIIRKHEFTDIAFYRWSIQWVTVMWSYNNSNSNYSNITVTWNMRFNENNARRNSWPFAFTILSVKQRQVKYRSVLINVIETNEQ